MNLLSSVPLSFALRMLFLLFSAKVTETFDNIAGKEDLFCPERLMLLFHFWQCWKPKMADFNAEERRVLEFLKSRETTSNTGISKELSMEEKKVNEILHVLRQGGFVVFKQDFHLARGELMVVKISNRGITALQEQFVISAPAPVSSTGYNFERITDAVAFALEAHKTGFRKGGNVPYVVHPLDVMSILFKSGAGEDLAIAGVLHDITEDTNYTLQDIKAKFGAAVASLVEGASEPEELTKGVSREEKRKTWKLRKSQKIEKMKQAPQELRLLICADKLANLRDLLTDYHLLGEAVWTRFNATKDEESWYYRSIAEAIVQPNSQDPYGGLKNTLAYKELLNCMKDIF